MLWRKLPGARSAGRVQSVALRLVCDRELEIERFVREEYWPIAARSDDAARRPVRGAPDRIDGKKLDQARRSPTARRGDAIKMHASKARRSRSRRSKPSRPSAIPSPPFTTSTLQQEASRKLGFAPAHTMRVAQRLYEGIDIGGETVGLITYMRTDGVQMAPEAIAAARARSASEFGERYLPPKSRASTRPRPRTRRKRMRPSARPTSRRPAEMRRRLDVDQAALYELIWKRAIASQMQPAEIERTTVEIDAVNGGRSAGLRAIGSVIRFDGFLAAYTEQKDDDDAEDDE